ncbi:MAG: type III-B CRISPR module-associated Cmr3 family protein [Gammaproteobacteria bacterium]
MLTGGEPKNLLRKTDLFHEEPRLGIARDNARRTVKESLLYQTRHIRLAEGVSVGVGVSGLLDKPLANSVLRFGGEGRPAGIRIAGECPLLSVPAVRSQNIVLLLLTHADFAGTWLPPEFKPIHENGIDCWRGELHGISLTLHSACIGKAVREGGWDLVTRQPRPVTGLVPAGSVYFCTVDGDPEVAVQTLHGSHIGDDLQLGRGELAVGFWQE